MKCRECKATIGSISLNCICGNFCSQGCTERFHGERIPKITMEFECKNTTSKRA